MWSDVAQKRKMWVCFLCIGIIVGSAILVNFMPAIAPTYTTLVGGVVSIMALYCGADVGHHYMNGRFSSDEESGFNGNGTNNLPLTPAAKLKAESQIVP